MELRNPFAKLPRCAHNIPANESCWKCNRRSDTPAQQAENVISVQQVMEAARLDVQYFRGCFHGALCGTAIGAAVVGALCHYLG